MELTCLPQHLELCPSKPSAYSYLSFLRLVVDIFTVLTTFCIQHTTLLHATFHELMEKKGLFNISSLKRTRLSQGLFERRGLLKLLRFMFSKH